MLQLSLAISPQFNYRSTAPTCQGVTTRCDCGLSLAISPQFDYQSTPLAFRCQRPSIQCARRQFRSADKASRFAYQSTPHVSLITTDIQASTHASDVQLRIYEPGGVSSMTRANIYLRAAAHICQGVTTRGDPGIQLRNQSAITLRA